MSERTYLVRAVPSYFLASARFYLIFHTKIGLSHSIHREFILFQLSCLFVGLCGHLQPLGHRICSLARALPVIWLVAPLAATALTQSGRLSDFSQRIRAPE